jgi:inner membrane protein
MTKKGGGMPWWAWIAVGLLLVAAELTVPLDFWLVFVGASAFCVGLLELAGASLGTGSQLLLVGGLSAAAAGVYQGYLKPRFARRHAEDVDALVGTVAVAESAIAPGGAGSVELRGARWSARNGGDEALEAGQRCVVERVDGLTLLVRKEG